MHPMYPHPLFVPLCWIGLVWCTPGVRQRTLVQERSSYFDVQAHRGGRGNTVESTLPSFAWGMIDGATTLELDNGITKDGEVVAWHDENIVAEKCSDTNPAFPNDPDFPYVGKYIVNLTLAQIKTLDCGSKRQADFPLQLTYPGTKISTLEEVFDFAICVDPQYQIKWNIESKINAVNPERTGSVSDFVSKQYAIFERSPYRASITYQSFDWRSLVAMKELDSTVITAALVAPENLLPLDHGVSPWLAGIHLEKMPGNTIGEKVAHAAATIHADILSPRDAVPVPKITNPTQFDFIPFTTSAMVETAHQLGLQVKPWTVNYLNIAENLLAWKVDGLITDYPNMLRRWIQQQGFQVSPKYPKKRALECLSEHLSRVA